MANTKLLEHEIHNLAEARSAASDACRSALTYQTTPDLLDGCPTCCASRSSREGLRLVRCAMTGFRAELDRFELVYDDRDLDADVRRAPLGDHASR